MKKAKSNQIYSVYKIENENELDLFLTNEVADFDSIHKNGNFVKVGFGGKKLFDFEFGDWLVVNDESKIASYSDYEFSQIFSLV